MSTGHQLRTWFTVRHALVEQAQNSFAMLLVLGFVPSWITLAHLTVPATPVPIRVHGVAVLTAGSDQLAGSSARSARSLRSAAF
ncbi:hypothetical protein ACGFX8_35350 [Streptomyces sp. NPDC048362]|uniref:hypothetical protein n=1 Tax=Streptomyces sp. NPDC048362 TaxID=3365539 RepID=UPI003715301A